MSDLARSNGVSAVQGGHGGGRQSARPECEGERPRSFRAKGWTSLAEQVKQLKGKGLVWVKVEADKFGSPIAKFLTRPCSRRCCAALDAASGDLLLFVADKEDAVCQASRHASHSPGVKAETGRSDQEGFQDCLGTRFPFLHLGRRGKRWAANHHPFTVPRDEDLDKLESDPGSVTAKAYDLVINGYEVRRRQHSYPQSGSAIAVFKVLGMNQEQARRASASCSTR